jgi:hypothetical protein
VKRASVKVERRGAENDVAHAFALERGEYTLDDFVVHAFPLYDATDLSISARDEPSQLLGLAEDSGRRQRSSSIAAMSRT